MGFWDIAWRYLVFFLPLYGAYLLGIRYTVGPPKLLAVLFSGANVGFLGYLVYLGVTAGGIGLLRSVAYATGTMFIVVGPVVLLMVTAAELRDRSNEQTPEE